MKKMLLFLILLNNTLTCGNNFSKPKKSRHQQEQQEHMDKKFIADAADAFVMAVIRKNSQHLCPTHYREYVNPDFTSANRHLHVKQDEKKEN